MAHLTVTIPDNKLQFFKNLVDNLGFKYSETKESPYNSEFVQKIKKSMKQADKGETTQIDNIEDFLGLE